MEQEEPPEEADLILHDDDDDDDAEDLESTGTAAAEASGAVFRQWLPKSHAQNASCICAARTASIHQSHELFSGTVQDRRCAGIVPMMR